MCVIPVAWRRREQSKLDEERFQCLMGTSFGISGAKMHRTIDTMYCEWVSSRGFDTTRLHVASCGDGKWLKRMGNDSGSGNASELASDIMLEWKHFQNR